MEQENPYSYYSSGSDQPQRRANPISRALFRSFRATVLAGALFGMLLGLPLSIFGMVIGAVLGAVLATMGGTISFMIAMGVVSLSPTKLVVIASCTVAGGCSGMLATVGPSMLLNPTTVPSFVGGITAAVFGAIAAGLSALINSSNLPEAM